MLAENEVFFKDHMVVSVNQDRKTQTRRIVKDQPYIDNCGNFIWSNYNLGQDDLGRPHSQKLIDFIPAKGKLPHYYGYPGDILWVREAWAPANSDDGPVICFRADGHRRYLMHEDDFLTDDPTALMGVSFNYEDERIRKMSFDVWAGDLESGRVKGWKPSIHMPRWLSRTELLIKNIRIERLQDISQTDAIKEGATKRGQRYCMDWSLVGQKNGLKYPDGTPSYHTESSISNDNPRGAFATYWEKINGYKSWDLNPWVWVIDFERICHE